MMGIKNILIRFLIVCFSLCGIVFAKQNDYMENQLTGMTVTKSFAGNYQVRLKLKKETEERYKLKDLGNSSYALIMPNVRLMIDNHDIYYENEHPDIKIVLSENRDMADRNEFYTKVNFKTKNDALIHVETYAPKSSKHQIILKKNQEEIQDSEDKNIPDWIWYIPVGILSAICLLLMVKSDDNSEDEDDEKSKNEPKKDKKILKEILKMSEDKNLDDTDDKQNHIISYQDDKEHDETDAIIDELVKVVIPQNDLVLMPGVPELPGLQKQESTKTVLKNVKIDLFDVENYADGTLRKKPIIPEKMSLAERLQNKDLLREADDIIFAEKELFFENISPIKDIPEEAEEKKQEENIQDYVQNAETENQFQAVNNTEQDEYDYLMNAFKQTLTVAHKLQDGEDLEPEVIDAFGVSDKIGFSLVKLGDKVSLVGNIDKAIFVIKTFAENELKNEQLFMEFCTQTSLSATYSVILNKFKALIRVSEDDISLIGEYD